VFGCKFFSLHSCPDLYMFMYNWYCCLQLLQRLTCSVARFFLFSCTFCTHLYACTIVTAVYSRFKGWRVWLHDFFSLQIVTAGWRVLLQVLFSIFMYILYGFVHNFGIAKCVHCLVHLSTAASRFGCKIFSPFMYILYGFVCMYNCYCCLQPLQPLTCLVANCYCCLHTSTYCDERRQLILGYVRDQSTDFYIKNSFFLAVRSDDTNAHLLGTTLRVPLSLSWRYRHIHSE
jgi:hypothetical protein